MQIWEYTQCKFCISDGVFGRVFFVTTGFHGLHVFIGVVFLTVAMVRLYFGHFRKRQNIFNVWASVWY